jgi:TonB family protein
MQILSRLVLTFVLNALWQLPLIAAAAAIGVGLMRRGPARYRYGLWAAALAVGLILPALSLRQPLAISRVPEVAVVAPAPREMAADVLHSGTAADAGPGHSASGKFNSSVQFAGQQFKRRTVRVYAPHVLAFLVLVGYLLLLLVRLSRLALAWKKTERIRRASGERPLPEWMQRTVARCKARFGVGEVPILASSLVRTPLTLGVRRPAIILPASLFDPANEPDLMTALCHEMAHVRRRDFAMNLVLELIHLPLTFHPAAGWMKRRIEETRELACDEMAAGQLPSPQSYARSLVSMAKAMTGTPSRVYTGHGLGVFDANILEERVMRILDSRPRASARLAVSIAILSGLLLAATCMAASLLSLRPEETRPTDSASSVSPAAFVGTWSTSFEGKPFLTLRLAREGQAWTGSMSPFNIETDKDGNLTSASAGKSGGWKVLHASLKADTLTVNLQDVDDNSQSDFELRLTGEGRATLKPLGFPVKPWDMARISTESAPAQSAIIAGVPGGVKGGVVGGVAGVGPIGGVVSMGPIGGTVGGVPGGVPGGVSGGVPGGVEDSPQSAAQQGTGSVKGTVFDPSGARVPDAVVNLIDEPTGIRLTTKTDQTGDFSFTAISPGEYSVEVEKPGFALYHQQKFALGPKVKGQELSVVLEPGEVIENIDVTALEIPGTAKPEEPRRPQRIRVGGLVEATKLREMKHPVYPEGARKRGVQGVVLLQAVISMQGEPLSLKMISSPDPDLAQAAIEAVEQWRYEPTLLNGDPIEVVTTIAVRFRLAPGPAPAAP